MSSPRLIPGTTGNHRWTPKVGGDLHVPLWTEEPEGEWHEGLIRVPTNLALAEPNTNGHLAFKAHITANLQRWDEWKKRRGWEMTTKPKLRGPLDPPTHRTGDEVNPDEKWYFALARFRRITPMYITLDDFLEIKDTEKRYGIDLKDPMPWSDTGGDFDSGVVNPLEFAAQRRERLGIKLEDWRMFEPGQPVKPPKWDNRII